MHTVICTPLYGHIIQQPTTIPTLYMYIHVSSSGTPVDTKFTVASFPGLRNFVGEKWRPDTHCLRMRQILHKICVNRVISVQLRVFITSQIQFGYGSANSASTLSRFHPSLNASPTLEILLVTDIALKVEQVSSTNAANDYIISLPTGYIRNLCHWFCNHLCMNGLIAWMSTVIFL